MPEDVLAAGRRLRDRVRESAPAPIAAAIERIAAVVTEPSRDASSPEAAAPPSPSASSSATPTSSHADVPAPAHAAAPEPAHGIDRDDVLRRVKQRAEHGLKPEDTLVVVYATALESEAVEEIVRCFEGIETTVRVMDLDREPQTKRQLAKLTDVMVPPYVFINGRYWGAQYEIVALAATGDLPAVVAHRLDEIGPEARRIGKVHDTYSDAITVENILARWDLGHILCVDDLDAWFERDKAGVERFFYMGGEQPVTTMPEVAADVVRRVDAGEIEAVWRLDTVVHVH
ncbi:MAG: hypothetical protein JNK45_16395 [Myxococcales bacterium]|nr:hypothetical protein [Myxococcales bacterium]